MPHVVLKDHFALCPQRWGGLLGTGTGGKGTKEWRLNRGYRPKKTRETVDCRQNNGSVKAVSPHHCPATCALHNYRFNCCAWAESQRQCPLHCCWATTRSERSPTFAAQLHLPAHDLFWANLKVQLHLPPLDLLISPGTLWFWMSDYSFIACFLNIHQSGVQRESGAQLVQTVVSMVDHHSPIFSTL